MATCVHHSLKSLLVSIVDEENIDVFTAISVDKQNTYTCKKLSYFAVLVNQKYSPDPQGKKKKKGNSVRTVNEQDTDHFFLGER